MTNFGPFATKVDEGKHAGTPVDATGPLVGLTQVCCPSILFVVLPTKYIASKYDELKRISEHVLGTQVSSALPQHQL